MPFSVGSIRQNVKLTVQVCFIYRALVSFDGIGHQPCADHHELNSSTCLSYSSLLHKRAV